MQKMWRCQAQVDNTDIDKNKKYSIDTKFKINKSNINIWEIQKGVDMKM